MTRNGSEPGKSGSFLTRILRVVFDEPTLTSVVHPAIADVQHELRELDATAPVMRAGIRKVRRAHIRLRGVWSLARVLVVVAVDVPPSDLSASVGASKANDFVSAVVVTAFFLGFAIGTPLYGWFTSGALIAGLLFAVRLHRWYQGYAGGVAVDNAARSRPVEINFASIPVGGNAGGLIVVVGSVAILLVGIPELRLFFLVAVGTGLLAASAIYRWRSLHPFSAVPSNTLVSRG